MFCSITNLASKLTVNYHPAVDTDTVTRLSTRVMTVGHLLLNKSTKIFLLDGGHLSGSGAKAGCIGRRRLNSGAHPC